MKKVILVIVSVVMTMMAGCYGGSLHHISGKENKSDSIETLLVRIQALEKKMDVQTRNTQSALQLMQRPVWYLQGFASIPEKKGLAVVYADPEGGLNRNNMEIIFFDPGDTLGYLLTESPGKVSIRKGHKIRFRPVSFVLDDVASHTTVCGGLLGFEWVD